MARTQGSKNGEKASYDFSNVAVTEGGDNLRTLRKSKVDDTPFPGWYAESWNTGLAKVMTLPTEVAKEAAQLASVAGRRFGIMHDLKSGVRTRTTAIDSKSVKFEFLAVDRSKDDGEVDDEIEDLDEDTAPEAVEPN